MHALSKSVASLHLESVDKSILVEGYMNWFFLLKLH